MFDLIAELQQDAQSIVWLLGGIFGGGGIVTYVIKSLITNWEKTQKESQDSTRELITYLKDEITARRDADRAKLEVLSSMTDELKSLAAEVKTVNSKAGKLGSR